MLANTAQNSFPKTYRLLSKNDFENLRKDSQFESSGILLAYFKQNEFSHARLGLAISKKVGNAVVRNKIKRKIREEFRKSHLKQSSKDLVLAINNKKIQKEKLSTNEVIELIANSFAGLSIS